MFASGGSRAIDITISLFDPGAVKVGKDLHGFGLIHSVTTISQCSETEVLTLCFFKRCNIKYCEVQKHKVRKKLRSAEPLT